MIYYLFINHAIYFLILSTSFTESRTVAAPELLQPSTTSQLPAFPASSLSLPLIHFLFHSIQHNSLTSTYSSLPRHLFSFFFLYSYFPNSRRSTLFFISDYLHPHTPSNTAEEQPPPSPWLLLLLQTCLWPSA